MIPLALELDFRIAREIGQGGMATVYLAEDLKHDRKVAIKVLRPELAAGSPSRSMSRWASLAGGTHSGRCACSAGTGPPESA
jgi:hypothetical protein